MRKPLPRSYWLAERGEQMRRARNGVFYATGGEISAWARDKWLQAARENVAAAREANWQMLRS